MKAIREQLAEQARTIEAEWAKGPSPDGMPRRASIELTIDSPGLPLRALPDYLDRVNSYATYAPVGCLLLRAWKTEQTGRRRNSFLTFARRITAYLEYREVPWNQFVLVADTVTFGAETKILVDTTANPAYQSADFDEWLDALEPPCGGTSSAPDEPSPESGSWLDRPALL